MGHNKTLIETLDLRGLKCPMPLLKTKKRLKSLASIESINVLADDPEASDDFNEYFEMSTRYKLIKETKINNYFEFLISEK